jgi:hypothetical protein
MTQRDDRTNPTKYAIGLYQPERETAKAVLDALWGWIPKSQIKGIYTDGSYTYVVIPGWLKRSNGYSDYVAGGKVWEWLSENDLRGLDKDYDRIS